MARHDHDPIMKWVGNIVGALIVVAVAICFLRGCSEIATSIFYPN